MVIYPPTNQSAHTATYHFVGIFAYIFLLFLIFSFTAHDYSGLQYVRPTRDKAPYISEIPINVPFALPGIDEAEQSVNTGEY